MSKQSTIVPIAALLAGGALAVAVGSFVPKGARATTDQAAAPKAATQMQKPPVGLEAVALAAATSHRLDQLEEHVRQIANRPPVDTKPPPELPPVPPDPKQVRRDALQHHEALLAQHDREGIDAPWARQSTPLIREDLTAVADSNKFHLVNVDCRTTTCTAVIEWSSFTDAVHTFQAVAGAPSRLKCTHQMTLPEPEAGAATYRATAFLDCEADRTGAANL